MARVFIDSTDLEAAVAVREAVQADDHDIAMVESAAEIESRLHADDDEIALVLTADVDSGEAGKMRSLFDARIPRPPVLALGASDQGSLDSGEKLVVDEWLASPPEAEEVRVVLNQQLDRYRVQLETGIIGRTRAVRDVLERLHLVAPVHSTVLLTGESGTGKELVARAIHTYSPRKTKPFIAVNCAALPESLLESELFGHEKGAFTGATSRRKGMFELADGGTIFLDEIGEMPPPLQTRLLRVLEQRRFMRVGGDTELEVNVRVVAATNRDLRRAVREGEFRRDLYYRLDVLHLELPPLRDRRDDVPVLVRRFVGQFTEDHGREFKGLTSDAMEILLSYDWPGNVRELRNLVESMVVLAPGSVIRAQDIPEEIRSGAGRALIPAGDETGTSLPSPAGADSEQLEFLFRTLVELKIDVEDLRREFERYRRRHPELVEGDEPARRGEEIEVSALEDVAEDMAEGSELDAAEVAGLAGGDVERGSPADGGEIRRDSGEGEGREAGTAASDVEAADADDVEEPSPEIRFQPGMTMSELEREAIVATLKDVDGNRRRAAEQLGIGERTLYRKLREYDIDL